MKKKHQIVGVVLANNNSPAGGKSTEPFWRQIVSVWFEVYGELLPPDPEDGSIAKPCFDGAEMFQLKIILKELRRRAEEKNIEWNEKNACDRFRAFLLKAWEDKFTSMNYMLKIISNRKTIIFNNQITPKKNGTEIIRNFGKKPVPKINQEGGFGKL